MLKRNLTAIVLICLLVWGAPATSNATVSAAAPIVRPEVVQALATAGQARIILNLAPSVNLAQAQANVLAQLPAADFHVIHAYRHVPALVGTLTAAGLAKAQQLPGIASIQLDARSEAHLNVSVAALQADVVHQLYGITGQGVTVAVLDTGIDTDHPDFAGAIVAQHCFTDLDCPPGNSNESHSAEDENGHGTNVAGIVAARGAVSGVGFAPAVSLVVVRVLATDNSGWLSDWVAGLDWIVANQSTLGVDVVNMSLGTYALLPGNCDTTFPSVSAVTAQLAAQGIIIFASTGNQGSNTSLASPACNSNVVAVGATYKQNMGREPDAGTYQTLFGSGWPNCFDATTSLQTITCFTNSNNQMDLVAPGAIIAAPGLGGNLSYYRGTSQAAPTAAGIAALMRAANPAFSPAQIEAALKSTGTPVVDPKNGLTFPLINALRATLATTRLSLSGPSVGEPNRAYTFSAAVTPFASTMPITYAWSAVGQTPVTYTQPLSNNVTFTWPNPGPKPITLTVTNQGGTFTVSSVITLSTEVQYFYLPGVTR